MVLVDWHLLQDRTTAVFQGRDDELVALDNFL